MILIWIVLIIETSAGRKVIDQFLRSLKPKLIQRAGILKTIKKTEKKTKRTTGRWFSGRKQCERSNYITIACNVIDIY